MSKTKCKIMRPPRFVETATRVSVEKCTDDEGPLERLGRFFVGDYLVSTTLKNGLVILAKKLSDGRTTKTEFDSAYSNDDLDCGLALDFYKDKIGFFKTTELRVRIDFTSVANMPKPYSTKGVPAQISFSSFYSVHENNNGAALTLSQIKLDQFQSYTNKYSGQKIELKFMDL